MTPFPPSFRRLLRRNIPQIKDEDLNRHEGLFALRHNLVLEKHIAAGRQPLRPRPQLQRQKPKSSQQPPRGFDDDIAEATKEAQVIFAPYAREYDASLRLWVARRRLVLQEGNFFQIPTTTRRLKQLVAAIWNYWKVQCQTFPTLAANRINYYLKNLSIGSVVGIAILVALLIIGLYTLMPKERPGPQQDLPNREQQLQ